MSIPAQPGKQRRDLRQRANERAERSHERSMAMWQKRFDEAESPLDLYSVAYSLLRTRLVQHESLAAGALDRATSAGRPDAEARLAAVRTEISQVCGEAAEYLAALANRFDPTLR